MVWENCTQFFLNIEWRHSIYDVLFDIVPRKLRIYVSENDDNLQMSETTENIRRWVYARAQSALLGISKRFYYRCFIQTYQLNLFSGSFCNFFVLYDDSRDFKKFLNCTFFKRRNHGVIKTRLKNFYAKSHFNIYLTEIQPKFLFFVQWCNENWGKIIMNLKRHEKVYTHFASCIESKHFSFSMSIHDPNYHQRELQLPSLKFFVQTTMR